jgi:hypothetical protein
VDECSIKALHKVDALEDENYDVKNREMQNAG